MTEFYVGDCVRYKDEDEPLGVYLGAGKVLVLGGDVIEVDMIELEHTTMPMWRYA